MPKSTLYATVVPTASKVPIALTDGKLAGGWMRTNFTDVSVVSYDYTLTEDDSVVIVTAGATITVPSAFGIHGRLYNIIRSGTGDVILTIGNGEGISGDLSLTLTSQWDSVVIVAVDSDGMLGWVRCS